MIVPTDPGKTPQGFTDERWRKLLDNARRAEQRTGVAPIAAEGWEIVAVLLMDQIDAIEADARPSREAVTAACDALIASTGGVRKAALACGEHPSNFVSIAKGRRGISREKLRRIEAALRQE